MPSEWFNTCGVPYRMFEDGRVEVQGLGFPTYTQQVILDKVEKIWTEYGSTITDAASKWEIPPAWLVGIIYIESGGKPSVASPCNEEVCPALWRRGLCSVQGGPEKYCAGGLMQFISATSAQFGKTMTYFIEHPHEMIHAGAELIAVGGPNRKNYGGGIRGRGGDVLSVVKMYNGGSPCGGGGITGHGGQADYVSKFVKTVNAFVAMHPETAGPDRTTAVALAFFAIGAIGFWYLDKEYGIGDAVVDRLSEVL